MEGVRGELAHDIKISLVITSERADLITLVWSVLQGGKDIGKVNAKNWEKMMRTETKDAPAKLRLMHWDRRCLHPTLNMILL